MQRKVAAHEVTFNGQTCSMHTVTIVDGHVTAIAPLAGEEPFTEWLGGRIDVITDENGLLIAVKDNKTIK